MNDSRGPNMASLKSPDVRRGKVMSRIEIFLKANWHWIILLISVVFEGLLIAAHINDPEFIADNLGTLVTTLIGALLGLYTGLAIDRRQQQTRDEAEQRAKDAADNTWLNFILTRVRDELSSNCESIKQLQDALSTP